MLTNITYFQILGKPLIMWLGIITLLMFIFVSLIPLMRKKKILKWGFKWHQRLAIIAIILALIHGFLGIGIYL